MTRDHTTSLQYDNVENMGEINNSLILEAEVTRKTFVGDYYKMNEKFRLLINGNINKLSVNVINCSLLLKQWLTGKFNSFLKHNMIMSGLNTEKLLMLLKFKSVMMQ